MQLWSHTVVVGLAVASAAARCLTSRDGYGGSPSWTGTNLYYLQALSDDDQDAYIQDLVKYDTKVIRLWVNSHQPGCEKGSQRVRTIPPLEDTIGGYNDACLDELDRVMVKLEDNNIKTIISPHDSNSLLGDYRADVYYDTFGKDAFYVEQSAFDAYDARLSYILNYQGTHSGRVWKKWPEAIMSFNLQNEPMTPDPSVCRGGDAQGWLCGRATHLRNELGSDSPIIVSTGGVGGDFSHECTFVPAVTQCDAVDAISVHRYASVPGKWDLVLDGWLDQANGKLVYLEEWGIDSSTYDQAAAFPQEVGAMNSVGLPSMYWQILPPAVEECPYDPVEDEGDHFGIFTDSNVDLAGPMHDATGVPAAQDWTGIVYSKAEEYR